MPLPTSCMRCHVLAPLILLGDYLWLCTRCAHAQVPTCPPGTHAYVGHAVGWLCVQCGAVVRATPVSAPTALEVQGDLWEY